MSTKTIAMDDRLYAYFHAVSLRETPLMQSLRAETEQTGFSRMQVAPEQGQLLGLLVELVGAKKVLEIGTFTGYSALWMALSLPPGGRLVCCDISEEWTSMARRYWQQAHVADRIDLRLAPATDTLQTLLAQGEAGSFDLVFLDADKENYKLYFEQAMLLLRVGGLCAIDNIFWSGLVADPQVVDIDTQSIRELTQILHADPRISLSIVPIGDGLLLARKR